MDSDSIEFPSLVEWLATFPLESKASITSDLSDGLAISEALVQIEPSFFTPSWFAGILHSKNSNNENLNLILNLILHYYRQNLGDVYTSGDLLLPEVAPGCEELSSEMIARFLKLMLGIAVTCLNKQTFISKIQSLEETTQHALTACVASFIYTKDWAGRVSAQSINSELKASTPPGDEIWAQKCHELDFQVALLKEERSNLVSENEELYGRVREAQTLSRKDSVKAKQFETEVENLKDEFDRLRMSHQGAREHMENIEKRIKPEEKDQSELLRLANETNALKVDLARLKTTLAKRTSEKSLTIEEGEVVQRLQEQQLEISELRQMVEYQASLQAGLVREMDCLKDQVDVLREQVHNHSRYEQELADIRVRLQDCQMEKENLAEIVHKTQTLTTLKTETCVDSQGNSMDLLDHSYSVSQSNLAEETRTPVKVGKKKLAREANVLSEERESEHIYVNNCNYFHAKEELRLVQSSSENKESACESQREGMCSTESDSGLDVTPEGTPFTSRPESELLVNDDRPEEDIKASPRQLEMLMEESNVKKPQNNEPTHEAVEELLRVLSDPNMAISVDEIEAIVCGREQIKQNEDLREENLIYPRHTSGLINQAEIQLFDPNDPKVKDLEEWNCSIHERSVIEEETPRRRLRKMFKMKKVTKIEERKLITEKYGPRDGYSDRYKDEAMSLECLKSWLLQVFVKVFD